MTQACVANPRILASISINSGVSSKINWTSRVSPANNSRCCGGLVSGLAGFGVAASKKQFVFSVTCHISFICCSIKLLCKLKFSSTVLPDQSRTLSHSCNRVPISWAGIGIDNSWFNNCKVVMRLSISFCRAATLSEKYLSPSSKARFAPRCCWAAVISEISCRITVMERRWCRYLATILVATKLLFSWICIIWLSEFSCIIFTIGCCLGLRLSEY